HFERHKMPMNTDLEKREAKDWPASHRVLRTADDVERLRCGKHIRPFKGNQEHWNMFGCFWGFGLENLSPDELADVFDRWCPCGSEGHDPDALKKHRERFKIAIGVKRTKARY